MPRGPHSQDCNIPVLHVSTLFSFLFWLHQSVWWHSLQTTNDEWTCLMPVETQQTQLLKWFKVSCVGEKGGGVVKGCDEWCQQHLLWFLSMRCTWVTRQCRSKLAQIVVSCIKFSWGSSALCFHSFTAVPDFLSCIIWGMRKTFL